MHKTVMIVNKELPLGLIANTTAVLGISLGRLLPDIVGPDILDGDGRIHRGITNKTVPILSGSKEQIKAIRDQLLANQDREIITIDFSEIAQKCLAYSEYVRYLAAVPATDLYYLGICLYGPAKKVNKLSGNLGLLR